MKQVKDLTGMEFGNFKVLRRGEDHIKPSGQKIIRWVCQCQCENKTIVIVNSYNLTHGRKLSCGCQSIKKFEPNRYCLDGEYGVGYTTKGEKFFFDLEDYDKIKGYRWYINSNGYVYAHQEDGSYISMHRLVMGFPEQKIDHKEFHRYDNRKEYLRVSTDSQNGVNKGKSTKPLKKEPIGVSYCKGKGKWISKLGYEHKDYFLGYYDNLEDAIIARLKAEKKICGEFAPQKKLFKKYGL